MSYARKRSEQQVSQKVIITCMLIHLPIFHYLRIPRIFREEVISLNQLKFTHNTAIHKFKKTNKNKQQLILPLIYLYHFRRNLMQYWYTLYISDNNLWLFTKWSIRENSPMCGIHNTFRITGNPNTLFRGNSLATKSMDQFMKVSEVAKPSKL